MVVGQEAGHKPVPDHPRESQAVSLEARYAAVHDRSGIAQRYHAGRRHEARNPHMCGTTSPLRVLFGKGLGDTWEEEFLVTEEGFGFHIFDAFALVNVLLCSAHPPRSATGRSSPTMVENCLEHFVATLRILEPTLLILQGHGVHRWVAPVLKTREKLGPYLARVEGAGSSMIAAQFSHPSARGALRWGDRLDAPYLLDVVEPTLRSALDYL